MYSEKITIKQNSMSESVIKDIAYIYEALAYREVDGLNKLKVRLNPWDENLVRVVSGKGGDKLKNDGFVCAYDLMVEKVEENITQIYKGITDKFDLIFSVYGERAERIKNQIKEDFDKSMQTSVDNTLKQLELLVMQKQNPHTFVSRMYDVLSEREKSLNELIHFECLQVVRFMILWYYEDTGYVKYKIFATGENCPNCNRMNRREFLISEIEPYKNFIPLHPNCNCNAGIINENGEVIYWLENDDISKDEEFRQVVKKYIEKTFEKFVLGDFSDKSQTELSLAGNILLGLANADIPMDIRDFTASINNFDGSPTSYFDVLLNTIAFAPIIGSLKYVDDTVDLAKPLLKNSDDIVDGGKAVVKNSDDVEEGVNYVSKNDVNDDINDDIIRDGSHLDKRKLKPNTTYKTGEHEYIYKTNERGLISVVYTDDLKLKTHEGRYNHNKNTYGKQSGDHAGHLFADRFGGSPKLDNLVSQSKNVNLKEFKKIEDKWYRALKNGQKVTVKIDISYPEVGDRPNLFEIEYTIDGKKQFRRIKN